MDPRKHAASILQQARDILADRLTERILESEQEILDDAHGHSFLSEIETVYEQIGGRLAHVNTMLSNLPPAEEPMAAEPVSGEAIYTDVGSNYQNGADVGASFSATLALPPPAITEDRLQIAAPVTTLHSFAGEILSGDLEGAGHSLARLFEVDAERGRECARAFGEKMETHPELLTQAMGLRAEVVSGNVNDALMLLWDCFGLQPVESINVLQSLKTRFSNEQHPQ